MWVEEIGLERLSQRRGTPRVGRTIRDKPIRLGGVEYPHGIGTRSISEFVIDLKGNATRFTSTVGIDDEIRGDVGSVVFEVWADDTRVAASGIMRPGDAPKLLSADLRGARILTLLVDDGGDTSNDDEVAWAGAMIELLQPDGERPAAYIPPAEELPRIAAPSTSPRPAIHGARVTGATPGRPFLFRVPATGTCAAAILRPGPSRGTRSRCVHRHHLRQDRECRRKRRAVDRARARRLGAPRAAHRGRQRCARAHSADGLEFVERVGPGRGCREGAASRGVARSQRARGARLPVHRHRRRVVRESAARTGRSSPTKNFRTCARSPMPCTRAA